MFDYTEERRERAQGNSGNRQSMFNPTETVPIPGRKRNYN